MRLFCNHAGSVESLHRAISLPVHDKKYNFFFLSRPIKQLRKRSCQQLNQLWRKLRQHCRLVWLSFILSSAQVFENPNLTETVAYKVVLDHVPTTF